MHVSTAGMGWNAAGGKHGIAASVMRRRLAGLCVLAGVLPIVAASQVIRDGQVSAGSYHTTVLKTNGTVWAWGHGLPHWAPSQVKGPGGEGWLTDIAAVSAGAWHTAALTSDGAVYTWGRNTDGQLGNGTTTDSSEPVAVVGPGGQGRLTGVRTVASGGRHTAALRADGTVCAWGRNTYGQLGNGTTTDSLAPVQVRGANGEGYLTDIAVIAAGFNHTLAVKADGTVWAWGRNGCGQLGTGTTADSAAPVQVKGAGGQGHLTDVAAVAPGWDHTLALKKDGTVWAWGLGWNGILGNGEKTDSATPVQVKGAGGQGHLTDVTAVAANWRHNLALKTDGTVWAWGRNQEGQLGNGTIVPKPWEVDPDLTLYETVPVQVRGVGGEGYFADVAGVAAAGTHSIAVKTDGTVFVWGSNNSTQLGLGQRGFPQMRSNPAQMPGLSLKD